MDTWETIVQTYTYIFDELSHPETKDWWLISSPLPLFIILASYNIFCAKIGPMLMKNRPPYKLETTIMLYNIIQVFISLYIFYEGYIHLFSGRFNFNCQGINDGDKHVPKVIQVYFVTKLFELMDTVFFVLRKSNRQISFLHLYHHTLMPTVSWVGLKYFPGGQGIIFGVINSFVHVVMYIYYFLSGLGPQYQKYLWWKKYLTLLQIVQFAIIVLHSFNSLFYSCGYLPALKVLTIVFPSIFIYMFSKFYYVTYIAKNSKRQNSSAQKKAHITNGNNCKNNESGGNHVKEQETLNNSINRALNAVSGSNVIINRKQDTRISNGNNHTKDGTIQFDSNEKRKIM